MEELQSLKDEDITETVTGPTPMGLHDCGGSKTKRFQQGKTEVDMCLPSVAM